MNDKTFRMLKSGILNIGLFLIILLVVGYVNFEIMAFYFAEDKMPSPRPEDVTIIDSGAFPIKPEGFSENFQKMSLLQNDHLNNGKVLEQSMQHLTFSVSVMMGLVLLFGLAVLYLSFLPDIDVSKKNRRQEKWQRRMAIIKSRRATVTGNARTSVKSMVGMVGEVSDSLDDLSKIMDEVNKTTARIHWEKGREHL